MASSATNVIGTIIWWIFGGIATAAEYLLAGVILCITIVGIPFGLQCFKMGKVMLFPFDSKVSESRSGVIGCVGNVLWLILVGFWIAVTHWLFGILLCITIIGIPFGRQHFKFAKVALTPFGREVKVEV
ncbi:MAG: YccF domain-containing protein [Porphyromonas sp.]|nr:YccF domain-containing protein [Porphyromonas sp.]